MSGTEGRHLRSVAPRKGEKEMNVGGIRLGALFGVLFIAYASLALSGCCEPCQQCPVMTAPTCPPCGASTPAPPACTGPMTEEWMDMGGTRILFPNGAAALDLEAQRLLRELVTTVRSRTDVVRVRVRGHTDSRGADSSNDSLSLQRAQSVINFLVTLGVPATLLEPVAMGDRVPLADESSPTEREMNRRVDFTVLVRRCSTGLR